MKPFLPILVLPFLAACTAQPGHWIWQHPDGTADQKQLWQDIYDCEEYAKIVRDEGPFKAISDARDYGGWGNFDFEFCMNQKNWFMKYQPIRPAKGSP